METCPSSSSLRYGCARRTVAALALSTQLLLLGSLARAQGAAVGETVPITAQGRHALEVYFEPLRREPVDQPLAVPVAMMASGYFTGMVAAIVALSAWSTALEIERYGASDRFRARLDINDDGAIDGRDELFSRRVARGFGVVSALGIGIGAAGTWLFARRLRLAREHEHARLALDASVSGRALTLSLRRGF